MLNVHFSNWNSSSKCQTVDLDGILTNMGCCNRRMWLWGSTNCAQLRGGEYNYTASSTRVPNLANVSTQIYYLTLESDLGYEGKVRYGFDDITLGFQGTGGPTLKNQTIGGIATKQYFMGIFGLTPRATNFSSDGKSIPSYMENLRSQSVISSISWGYTAGNQYR